ncbi:hypothetical protein [Sinorhizobium terangae]|uniref:hypothetical protein n=2 Tax=Sinorhizobium TaxID=28105 RepID=UPI0024B171EB|nr:hypothetical protein [Sinorhizobium terangae]WFU51811.1 hypothetical protein QA637_30610 [Sinorhizobium terangae]
MLTSAAAQLPLRPAARKRHKKAEAGSMSRPGEMFAHDGEIVVVDLIGGENAVLTVDRETVGAP